MSNVVQLFPKKERAAPVNTGVLPTIPGIHEVIHSATDWAVDNNIDVYRNDEFSILVTEFIQRLQLLAYRAAA